MFMRSPRNGITVESILIFFSFAIAVPALAPAAVASEIESRIARGGLLYDYWSKLNEGLYVPKETHPAYPKTSKKIGRATWRCKECHGWDYKGKDGYYGKGDNFTGIKGIKGYAGDTAKVVAILKDANHALTDRMLGAEDFENLALFVTKGQIDMDKYIDPQTKKAKGDAAKGAGYYNTICAKCHGLDGTLPKELEEPIGKLSNRVPWEVLHKIRNGEPGEEMPALRALPVEVSADILAHAQTLPQEKKKEEKKEEKK
jgi:thiosulfate dehydrogenase